MENSWMTFVLPIITALLAYAGSRYQYKMDLKKQTEVNHTELEKVREQCKNEIDKIQIQLDAQAKLYEKNAQTDFMSQLMSNVLNDPDKALKAMDGMNKMANKAKKFNR